MIANIQVLRAVAALMIVAIHCGKLLRPLDIAVPWWPSAGVDIFFVISGFIMVHTSERTQPGAIQFLRDRLIRIVPVYWLFTGVMFGLVKATGAFAVGPADLLRSLLFIPYGPPTHFFPLLYVGWTLNLEIYFYALFAIGLALVRDSLRRAALVTAMIAVPVIAAPFLPRDSLLRFYGLPMVLEFPCGMALALLHGRIASMPRWVWPCLLALGALLLIADPMLALTAEAFARFGLPATLIVAGALAAEAQGWRLTHRAAQGLGAASYVLYVSHLLVISVFNNIQRRVDLFASGPGAAALLAGALAAVVLFALLAHRLIERPLGSWLRRTTPGGPGDRATIQRG